MTKYCSYPGGPFEEDAVMAAGLNMGLLLEQKGEQKNVPTKPARIMESTGANVGPELPKYVKTGRG